METMRLVEEQYAEMLETMAVLTKIDRGSKHVTGIEKTTTYLTTLLKPLGCEVIVHPDSVYGPTLVARKSGSGKGRIIFYAHMDTVWPECECERRPFHIEGDYAYGPGVSDCTHGIVAQIYMLKTLIQMEFDNYGEIVLLFNPDEEITSPSSTQWIKKYSEDKDVAFCMEGPDHADEYVTSRSGSIYYEIKVTGIKAHAGVEPEKGRNAIAELCYKLNLIQQLKIPNAVINLSFINGGSGMCIVADEASAIFRYRINSLDVIPELNRVVEDTITYNQLIEGTSTTLTHLENNGFLPLVKNPETDKFSKLVDAVSADMSMPLKESHCGGGADAVSSSLVGIPTLDGLAPVTYGCHTIDERLDLRTLVPRISLLVELVKRICTDDKFRRT